MTITSLLVLRKLAAAGLLGLEVLVQEVQSLLVGLSASHDGEHALSGLVVRGLCNRNPGSRASADLRDLSAAPANDAAHHVSRNADILRLDLFAVLGDKRVSTVDVGVGSSAVATGVVTEIGSVACPVVGTSAVSVVANRSLVQGPGTDGRANRRVVKNSASAALPVVDEALSDFPNRLLDALGSSLHFDDTFSRLGEHFLLSNHAHTGSVLDVLDFQALSSDNGTHLVVGNEETNRWEKLAYHS